MGSQIWVMGVCVWFCTLSLMYVCSEASLRNGSVQGSVFVDGKDRIGRTDDDFVCATLDWWPPEKCDYGTYSWGQASLLNLDLNNGILLKAMASNRRRDDRPTVPPKHPHFFKIILPNTIASAKLKIPTKFVKKYGNTLSDSIYLKVPSGEVWQVDVMRDEGEVSLRKRWTQFAEHHALDFGHMLVFTHEGDSTFSVVIFDKSATEIDYPSETIHAQEFVASPKTEPFNEGDIYFVSETESGDNVHQSKRKRTEESIEESHHSLPDLEAISSACGLEPEPEPDIFMTMKTLTSTEKTRALARASSFKTKNPNFMVLMQPSYVSKYYKAFVPIFFGKYLTRRYYDVILETSDGRTWSVKYVYRLCSNRKMQYAIIGGWKSFVKDNSLGVGDVCVFELKEKSTKQLSFKVVIFRFTADKAELEENKEIEVYVSSDSCDGLSLNRRKGVRAKFKRNKHGRGQVIKLLSGSEIPQALEEANRFVTKNPSFILFMSPGNTDKSAVSVPTRFVNKHLKSAVFETMCCDQECEGKKKVTIQLQVGNKSWDVNLLLYPSGSSKFCRGWVRFASWNNLGQGDACVFELINLNNVVLKVTIFRCT